MASPRLRRLARGAARERPAEQAPETCDLCGEPIPAEHRHLLDLSSRELLCACRACSLLFDRRAAGGEHYRLIPDRRLRLDDFELDDVLWANLRIPVEMAFFFHSTPAERVLAFYPGPMGATESLLELESWEELERTNPILGDLEPDVEALLVNRARGARSHWLVPIDDCYRLVATIRTHWKGLSGGRQVWDELGGFFERLGRQAKPVTREGVSERRAPAQVSGADKEAR